jgi:hypothetical protein
MLVVLALPLAGCGGGSARPPLGVAAAQSLKPAVMAYARTFPGADVQATFSSAPANAVRRRPRPDVVAAPAANLPALYRAGLVERPQVLGSTDLTLAVPKRHHRVGGLTQIPRPGVRLAIVTGASPAAAYTRLVFARMKPAQRAAIMAHVGFRVDGSAAAAQLVRSHRHHDRRDGPAAHRPAGLPRPAREVRRRRRQGRGAPGRGASVRGEPEDADRQPDAAQGGAAAGPG